MGFRSGFPPGWGVAEECEVNRKRWGREWSVAGVLAATAVVASAVIPASFAPNVDIPLGPAGCAPGAGCSEGAVAAVAGDFNDDDKLDIATANNGSDNATVLLGDGHGGLAVHTTLTAGLSPSAIAAGILDANTVLDLVARRLTTSNQRPAARYSPAI